MKTSNANLLNEIDVLEGLMEKDSNDLEVVKHIDKLEDQVRTMSMLIRMLITEKQSVRTAKKYLMDNGLQGNPLRQTDDYLQTR